MKYKKLTYKILIGLFIVGLYSCDKGFEETNTNPTAVLEIDPSFTFANAQRLSIIDVYIFENDIVQQVHSPFTGTPSGGNLNVENDAQSSNTWNNLYTGPIKLLTDVIDKTQGDPDQSNLYNMARIWRAYIFQVLVDTFGDIPYSQAGVGFLSDITLPVYDDSEVIYNDILKEFKEATAALDASQPIAENDLFYNGNISNWKKLGNSLLLRGSMRLSKVNPAQAEQGVNDAVNAGGGLISSNADNARVIHSGDYSNEWANFIHQERSNTYIGKPFLDHLKDSDDPRLVSIAVKYENPSQNIGNTGAEDKDPANQIGMPYGYNDSDINTEPNYPGKIGTAWAYSQVDRSTIAQRYAGPAFIVTYSQTQLLLAEAVERGWITGDVETLYNTGVKAHMDQMALYHPDAAISTVDQDAYLVSNPFDAANALEDINTQYWVSSFLNGHEVWANFRRSGFPDLAPNTYSAQDPAVQGGFIHRLNYPSREAAVNPANLNAAIARMGPDNLATRIFWDN